jgi:hypothetical protein
MPRTAKPPRLYLRAGRRDRGAVWVIKNRGIEFSTGAGKTDRAKAEKALGDHIAGKKCRRSFREGHPDQVLIVDALTEYGERHAPTIRRRAVIGIAIDKLADFWKTAKVSAITPAACSDYVAWRTVQTDGRAKTDGRPVKASTARREQVVLAAAVSWCRRGAKLDRAIPVRLPAQAEPRERHLTLAEAARLLTGALGSDAKGKRHHALSMLGLYTGTRHDAILKPQWALNTFGGWIDLESRILYRRPADVIDAGMRRPTIRLPPRLRPHLRRWRKLTARFVIEWHGLQIRSQERRARRRAPRRRCQGDAAHPCATPARPGSCSVGCRSMTSRGSSAAARTWCGEPMAITHRTT